MTCPFQYYCYKNTQHSYRDLPIRYGETSTLALQLHHHLRASWQKQRQSLPDHIYRGEKFHLARFTLPRAEAIKFMEEKGEPYKVELIQDLPEDAEISFYKQGEGFTDLCAGPHSPAQAMRASPSLISSAMS